VARWTRFALRFRWPILRIWLVVVLDRSDGELRVLYKIRNGSAGVRLKLERSIRRAGTAALGAT
jgi:hypothetical protein